MLGAAVDPWLLLLVPVTGFVAGFINTLAGSGSLITLPVLILLGLPPTVANGTNRVGILVQSIVSVATFLRHGKLRDRAGLNLLLPSVLGGIVGAAIAVNLDETLLQQIIAGLMLLMLAVVLLQPDRWLEDDPAAAMGYPGRFGIFFLIGVYGGFIQAGVGVFLLAGLVLAAGFNLVRANAFKNLVTLCFTVAAMPVFIFNDQVDWSLGLLLAAGNAGGAWLAARLAITRGAGFVRWVLIVILALASIALLL